MLGVNSADANATPTPPIPMVYVDEPVRWEYKIVERDAPLGAAELNDLGGEGWELVAILPHSGPQGGGAIYYFKRVT